MKLIKRLSPNRLFRSKKTRSDLSRSDPPSFGSGTSSSSSSVHSSLVHNNFELLQAFKLIDTHNNEGIVSRKELEALLSRVGSEPPTREEVAMMLSEVDCAGDGFISLEALMARLGSACGSACESELRETFEFFDADHDGRITAEELQSVFISMGDERCTLDDCRRMIADVDENGDGFVCFAEFVRMMDPQRGSLII